MQSCLEPDDGLREIDLIDRAHPSRVERENGFLVERFQQLLASRKTRDRRHVRLVRGRFWVLRLRRKLPMRHRGLDGVPRSEIVLLHGPLQPVHLRHWRESTVLRFTADSRTEGTPVGRNGHFQRRQNGKKEWLLYKFPHLIIIVIFLSLKKVRC